MRRYDTVAAFTDHDLVASGLNSSRVTEKRQAWLQGAASAAGSSSKALDVQRYDAVADFGDHDLVASGLHENFHAARYLDMHMARTAAILGHLADGDALTARMQRRSDYALLKFAPAHALSIRAIVAGPSRLVAPKLARPQHAQHTLRLACTDHTSSRLALS